MLTLTSCLVSALLSDYRPCSDVLRLCLIVSPPLSVFSLSVPSLPGQFVLFLCDNVLAFSLCEFLVSLRDLTSLMSLYCSSALLIDLSCANLVCH